MGRTPKPLKIVPLSPCNQWSEIHALAEQGHDVVMYPERSDLESADLILGPTCWLMDEQHRKYLDLAISEARRRRYPPKEKGSPHVED